MEPTLCDRYDPANVARKPARTARFLRAMLPKIQRHSERIILDEPTKEAAPMIHFQNTFFLRAAFCVALTSSAFTARAQAQDSKPQVAPGTSVTSPQSTPAGSTTREKSKYLRYLRVGQNGTEARNLGDANGVGVAKLSGGALVAVYEEHGDWLECEIPGGFEIWVYGQYVKASSEAGVLEITRSDVRARPLPSSGVESYPLQPNLAQGDRVRLIARNDSTKPLAEDWIKVYSPPGVRGFVAKADCEALAPGTDGAAAWASAVIDARKRSMPAIAIPAGGVLIEGSAGKVVGDLTPQQAIEELKRADSALAAERLVANPNFTAVKEQYEHVAASVKEGATHDMAVRGLNEIQALVEAHALRDTLQVEREHFVQENLKRQEALDAAAKNKDIYSGRFDTRGWVEKRNVAGQAPTYLLRWGGDQVSEILCKTGRYDLSTFNGYEVGVNGIELRSFIPGDISHIAVPRLIDAARIEVLSGRQAQR